MKRSAKTFYLLFFLCAILTISFLPILNLYIDEYRVFSDYSKVYKIKGNFWIEPNKAYSKMRYILDHKKRYDSFLLGSSRVDHIPIDELGENWFNYTNSVGILQGDLRIIKVLIKKKIPIKNIWIGIDFFNIYESFEKQKNGDFLRRPYPITLKEWIDFYKFYLFKPIKKRDIDILHNKIKLLSTIKYPTPYQIIPSKHHNYKYLNNKDTIKWKILDKKITLKNSNSQEKQALLAMRKIIKLSKKHHFNLKFFINPHHYKNYLSYNRYMIDNFLKEMAKISDFYDFSGLDEISTDNRYWYETSHYIDKIGKKILNAIQNKNNKNYGFLVTKKNIRWYLKEKIKKDMNFLQKIPKNDKNLLIHPTFYYSYIENYPQNMRVVYDKNIKIFTLGYALIYAFKKGNDSIKKSKFFLHIYFSSNKDLPKWEKKEGFLNKDFWWKKNDMTLLIKGKIYAIKLITLPHIPIKKIVTGQFNNKGELYKTVITN